MTRNLATASILGLAIFVAVAFSISYCASLTGY